MIERSYSFSICENLHDFKDQAIRYNDDKYGPENIPGYLLRKKPIELLERAIKDLKTYSSLHFGTMGIVNVSKNQRFVGMCGDFLEDFFIEEDKKKNANLRLALNTLEWLSQPTLHKLTEKPKAKYIGGPVHQ